MKSDKILNLIPKMLLLDEKAANSITDLIESYIPKNKEFDERLEKTLSKDNSETLLEILKCMELEIELAKRMQKLKRKGVCHNE